MTDATSKTAILAGATGLVGGHLLPKLLTSPIYDQVIAIGRRALDLEHPKLKQILTPLESLGDAIAASGIRVDDAFCALGTTIRKAGSQEVFRRVDHDSIVAFAQASRSAGARRFFLVSAIGADAKSGIFYSRVKGETERDVDALGFAALHIFQPGLLLGARNERRPAETLAQIAAPFLNPLLVGPLSAYRSVPADILARAMIGAAKSDETGRLIYAYDRIKRLAEQAN